MATIQDIMTRAQSLRNETALNSITPERAGGIMFDTASYINQMQLQGSNPLLISKVYDSVASMGADDAPVSDITGEPLRPGQIVCISTTDPDDPENGLVYRYDGTEDNASSWTAVGRIGSNPYLSGSLFGGILTPESPSVAPTQKMFYLAFAGVYENFGNTVVNPGEIGVFSYDSDLVAWTYNVAQAITIVDNLFEGGAAYALSANQGKSLWGAAAELQGITLSRDLVNMHTGSIKTSAARLTGNFFLKAGRTYTIEAKFDAQPAANCQVNLWVYKDGATSDYLARLICYYASWATVRSDEFTPAEDGMYYIRVRAFNAASSSTMSVRLNNPDSLQKKVEDEALKLSGLSDMMLKENVAEAQAVASSSSSAAALSSDFFLLAGAQYTLSAKFDDQPTDNAQVNIWVYKSGTTSGYLARVILYGGDSWDGPRSAKFSVPEDGEYYIAYRVVVGGAQTAKISAVIDNPLYRAEADVEDDLPEYYFPYLKNRVDAAKLEMSKCGANSACFLMITDTHNPQNFGQSGKMLRYVSERLQVRSLLFGGDICPSLTSNWGGEAAGAEEAIALSDNALTQLISGVRAKIFRLKGNHDYSVADYPYWVSGKTYAVGAKVVLSSANTAGGDNYSYECIEANSDATFDPSKWTRGEYGGAQLSQIQSQRLILADAEDSGVCVFPDNGTKASYYYFDIPRAKLRVICWDCSDTDYGFAGISNVTQRISDEQFAWMISNAILTTPADYRILSYGHIPVFLNQSMSNGGYNTAAWNISRRQLIAAINSKTSVTIGGVSYDFSGFSPSVIMDLAGHTHADCITRVSGAFGVTIAADYWGNDTKNAPVYYHFGIGSLASRDGGTVREQAFDMVIVDTANDYLRFLRFGAGIDRYLRMTQESVSLDSTLQITPNLSGEIEYYVYDADLRAQDIDGKYRPTSTRASIDSSGVLTPISAGDVVVMAYDTENKIVEVIGVTIA